jgi:hypothetical protein
VKQFDNDLGRVLGLLLKFLLIRQARVLLERDLFVETRLGVYFFLQ